MKLSLPAAFLCASLVSAKKKPKTTTTTTRIPFTPTFLQPKHFTKGWTREDANLRKCGRCIDVCAVAPIPKWLDEYYTCVKWKCSWAGFCKPSEWGVFPKVTIARATANSTSFATSNANATWHGATLTAAPTVITVTSTTAPGPTSSLATASSTGSVTSAATTTMSTSSSRRHALRQSFITSMVPDEWHGE